MKIPNRISIVGDGKMILELVEAHLHRLAAVVQKCCASVPPAGSSLSFQRLIFSDDLLVPHPSPEPLIVIGTSWLVRLVGLHLRLPKVLCRFFVSQRS
jgi:hypothetical protein